MKNLFFFCCLFISITLFSQEQSPTYSMFQSIELEPIPGHGQELRAALKAHNQKYHTTGVNTANVWAINSGPRTGNLLWIKGPLTWSDMDNPIEGNDHMDDWRTNVGSHSTMKTMEYWRLNSDLYYMPENLQPKVMVIRYFNIAEEKGNNAEHIFGTILKIYKEKNFDLGMQVFSNQANADGQRDWAIVWFHDSWSSMDRDRELWSNYEEMFGMDRREFFENWNEATKMVGMEICTLAAGLSAATNFTGGN